MIPDSIFIRTDDSDAKRAAGPASSGTTTPMRVHALEVLRRVVVGGSPIASAAPAARSATR